MERSLRDLTDAELISRSHADPGRFGEIFDRHFGPIHRYLRRRVGLDLADELASETFAVAFRRREAFDRNEPDARPWLFGIASHLLRHHHRTERRKLAAYARTGVDPIGAHDPGFESAEDRAGARALGPILAGALAALAPGDRDVLLLAAWADLSYREIAGALGIPTGTVRSRLSRARRQVRERLGASGQALDAEPVLLEGGRDE